MIETLSVTQILAVFIGVYMVAAERNDTPRKSGTPLARPRFALTLITASRRFLKTCCAHTNHIVADAFSPLAIERRRVQAGLR